MDATETKGHRDCYEELDANNLDDLEETAKFLVHIT